MGGLVRGEVLEYCSQEMGLLTLNTGHTVLFHRNQVPGYNTTHGVSSV